MPNNQTKADPATTGPAPAATCPDSASTDTSPCRPGRPRMLDESHRREVCALLSAGSGLHYAARYVGCSVSTLKRERRRDPEFHERLRRAEMSAALHPLAAMKKAADTHWRAAAWMLERTMPDRFSRAQPKAFGKREARQLVGDLVRILRDEMMPDSVRKRLEQQIAAAVQYATRTLLEDEGSRQRLRAAMKYFDQRDRRGPRLFDREPITPSGIESIRDGSYVARSKLWNDFQASAEPTPSPTTTTPTTTTSPPSAAAVPQPSQPATAERVPAAIREANQPNDLPPARKATAARPHASVPTAERHLPSPERDLPSSRSAAPHGPRETGIKNAPLSPEVAAMTRMLAQGLLENLERERDPSRNGPGTSAQKNAPPTSAHNGPNRAPDTRPHGRAAG